MPIGGVSVHLLISVLQFIQNELMIFALFWFVIGAIDETAIDLVWLWLRLIGRARTPHLPADAALDPVGAPIAVFLPAWREADVIGTTVAYMLRAWPQTDLRIYVGCYVNDPATLQAARTSAGGDPRVSLVVIERGIM